MELYLANESGGYDVTGLVSTVSVSGDYQQIARTLQASLLSFPTDSRVPEVDCPVGSAVRLTHEGETLFDGYVISRTKSTAANTIDLTCYDRGFYLKRIRTAKKVVDAAPEAVVAELCGEYGIDTGGLAATGVTVSRKFLGQTLYEIIATLYTIAGRTTGEKYHIGFDGDRLCVRAKGPSGRVTVIRGDSNLMDASVTESVENMVNSVAIYNQDGLLQSTVQREGAVQLYGLMQEYLQQANDAQTQAESMLSEDPEQKITVNCLGDPSLVTGGCAIVREPYTGLYGLFYIDSDTHTWKNGQYYNRLVLNFKAMMDEKEVGEAIGG
ncbi:hypothetical protein H8711_11220 [Clostridiaceae bacterium NSJ-31]|uniref:YqbQ/XkdQ domain-containing protein n=1 Tax=Ligaoa zhengdingensis TaxID=2763658 RepID=A0A926DYB2_9FIRM|nr:hypothetical protein [Ligaoa zhengdingensis]MBC8547495.1 hypothetical protein [Ligaoa zhengdingensis]